MNLQRREEIRAIAECPNDRHWAQEMRRAVAEPLAHIDALEQTAAERVIADGKVRAVVVLRRFAERCAQRDHQPDEHIGSAKCVACEAEDALRAIPADRVLGEGMVAVDRHELALLRKIAGMWCPPFGVPHNPESVALFDALRANQGGAAT